MLKKNLDVVVVVIAFVLSLKKTSFLSLKRIFVFGTEAKQNPQRNKDCEKFHKPSPLGKYLSLFCICEIKDSVKKE